MPPTLTEWYLVGIYFSTHFSKTKIEYCFLDCTFYPYTVRNKGLIYLLIG